jgi:uncharacterized membrane protein
MSTLIPSKIAKYGFAAVMALFGINHFLHAGDMAGMVPTWLPGGSIWVYLTGAALVMYAVAIFMNHKMQKMAGYLLALLLLIIIICLHLPGMSSNPMAMPMILKDLAMAFAAIYIANDSPAAE